MTRPGGDEGGPRPDLDRQDKARIRSRLSSLGKRLGKAQSERTPRNEDDRSASGFGYAMRMAIDMVAGIVVGGAIGWYLDRWLDTKPVLTLLVGALGVAAGFLNLARTYRKLTAESGTDRGEDLPADALDDDED